MGKATCVVTGATGAIGKATALALAKRGAEVILLARDPARGEAVRVEVAKESGNSSVQFLPVDLSRPHAVREAAQRLQREHARLHALINSAVVYKAQREVTGDGLEIMFATNHLGPFMLTNLLLDNLKAGAPSQVVTITAPSTTELDFDDLQGTRTFSALNAFGASKMCNILFTYELARRLEGTGVAATMLHPGVVRSTLMREAPLPVRLLTGIISAPPEAAGEAVARLVFSSEVQSANGKFFNKKLQQIKSATYSYDTGTQGRLWEESMRLAGM